MTDSGSVVGWVSVVDWFGFSPNFHDAEIVSVDLRRDPEASFVRVHTWRTNKDLTESGHFRQDRHALVTFKIKGIQSANLIGWNHQNVISKLWIDRNPYGFVLHLPDIYGLDGKIAASEISVSIEAYEI